MKFVNCRPSKSALLAIAGFIFSAGLLANGLGEQIPLPGSESSSQTQYEPLEKVAKPGENQEIPPEDYPVGYLRALVALNQNVPSFEIVLRQAGHPHESEQILYSGDGSLALGSYRDFAPGRYQVLIRREDQPFHSLDLNLKKDEFFSLDLLALKDPAEAKLVQDKNPAPDATNPTLLRIVQVAGDDFEVMAKLNDGSPQALAHGSATPVSVSRSGTQNLQIAVRKKSTGQVGEIFTDFDSAGSTGAILAIYKDYRGKVGSFIVRTGVAD
jgi:hypothetical protein